MEIYVSFFFFDEIMLSVEFEFEWREPRARLVKTSIPIQLTEKMLSPDDQKKKRSMKFEQKMDSKLYLIGFRSFYICKHRLFDKLWSLVIIQFTIQRTTL